MKQKIDYANTPVIFYRIACKDKNIHNSYVGHTINFKKRKRDHKYACNNSNDKRYNLKVYQIIRNNNGWINWSIIIIDTIILSNLGDVLKLEQQYIDLFNTDMNSINSYIDNKKYLKEYYEKNRTKKLEYYCINKDELNAKRKVNYLLNKNAITTKKREYDLLNKDKINARRRELRLIKKQISNAII